MTASADPNESGGAAARLADLLTPAPEPERRRLVAAADRGAADPVFGVETVRAEDGYIDLPVVRLPHRALLYRIDNGRLMAEVAAYAASRGVSVEALLADGGARDVQTALHELLIDMARDPKGPVFAELDAHARQTAPLLVRRDGVVINGNRRLSAMRALLADAPERFAAFEEVAAALLPDGVSAASIEFIEASLQMAPDLKLDYGWANRRLKLRAHARDLPAERIVEAYRFRSADAVARELDELSLAEDYLERIGAPGAFERLDGAEPLIEALQERLAALRNAALRRPWRLAGFAMLASRAALDRPIALYFPFAEPKPPAIPAWTLARMAEELGVGDAADQDGGDVDGPSPALAERLAARLAAALETSPSREEVARAVLAQIDALQADDGRLLGPARALKHLRQARRSLEAARPDAFEAATVRLIRAELASIQALAGDETTSPVSTRTARRGGVSATLGALARRFSRRS